MTIDEYKERLKKHDWYYLMSDDPRVYDTGLAEEIELKKLSFESISHKEAFEDMQKKMFPNS